MSAFLLAAGIFSTPKSLTAQSPDCGKTRITSVALTGGPMRYWHAPWVAYSNEFSHVTILRATTCNAGSWMSYYIPQNSLNRESVALGYQFSLTKFWGREHISLLGFKTEVMGSAGLVTGYWRKGPTIGSLMTLRTSFLERKTGKGTWNLGAEVSGVPFVVVTQPLLSLQYKPGR